MSILYRIFRIIFTLYASIVFGITFFIVIPCFFLIFNLYSKQRAPHIAHRLSHVWAQVLIILFFVRAVIKNKKVIDPDKTYIFVANHLSFLDIPLYALSCRNTFRFLSKAELAKIPVLGYVIKNLYITVDRNDRADRSLSLKKMKQSLDEHISIFLCPEGTRNQTAEPLLPFKDGAFRLAIESGTPLAVLTIFNSNVLLNPKRWFSLSPGVVYAEWHEPIVTTGMKEEDLESLKSTVREIMLSSIRRFEKGRK
jgi:1-acyl-sn-glycerol-3-phosphate acyltransferase